MTDDMLSIPAGECKEPTFPLLAPDRVYRMVIRGFEKAKSTKSDYVSLNIKLQTTKDEQSVDGQTIYTGATVFARIGLTPNETFTAQRIAQEAAMPVKAALGSKTTKSVADCLADPSLLLEKLVDVKIGIQVDKKGQFPDTNFVKKWILPS